MSFEIATATKNRIVLAPKKEQFMFLRHNPRYSKVNAFNLSLLTKAAYLEETPIREFLFVRNTASKRVYDLPGVVNVSSAFLGDSNRPLKKIEDSFRFILVPETNTQFFYFKTEEYVLFSFRGTQEGPDWLTNLNSQMVNFSDGVGKVHAGFHKAFLSAKPTVDEAIKGESPDKPILICGHSLGGAITNLVAAYLRKKNHTKVMIYTFGSPLVGDTDFTNHFSKIQPIVSYRFVHNQDLVPMVPPPHSNLRLNFLALALANPLFLIPATIDPFGKPFNHFGKLVFIRRIDRDTFSVDVDRKTPAYIRAPSSFPVNIDRPKWDAVINLAKVSVNEHFMENYVSILGSDLKFAIRSYQGAKESTIKSVEKVIAYLESELRTLRASHEALEKKMLIPGGIVAYPDATATAPASPDRLSPSEKLRLLDEAIQAKQLELGMQRNALAISSAPGFAQSILSEIIDQKMSANLKNELEYHKQHILY